MNTSAYFIPRSFFELRSKILEHTKKRSERLYLCSELSLGHLFLPVAWNEVASFSQYQACVQSPRILSRCCTLIHERRKISKYRCVHIGAGNRDDRTMLPLFVRVRDSILANDSTFQFFSKYDKKAIIAGLSIRARPHLAAWPNQSACLAANRMP
jgi:hypothetical protein